MPRDGNTSKRLRWVLMHRKISLCRATLMTGQRLHSLGRDCPKNFWRAAAEWLAFEDDLDDFGNLTATFVLCRNGNDPTRLEVGERYVLLDEPRLAGIRLSREADNLTVQAARC